MHCTHFVRRCLPVALVIAVIHDASGADVSPRPDQEALPPILEELQSIRIESGRTVPGAVVVAGRDAGQQLIVTGELTRGELVDVTRYVEFRVEPPEVLTIDQTGYAAATADGLARVTARIGQLQTSADIEVQHFQDDLPVNFPNEVVPIFTKFGCNAGGCHGKASGQNGFRLSLLGFEPREDYEFLLKEARGRRLFPAAPDYSLLLRKATAQIPHGGGQRLDRDSPFYRILRRWIAQGMPYGSDSDPVVVGIDVLPQLRILKPGSQQQLIVTAHYSDGSQRDVTRMAKLESNNAEMAEITPSGLITTLDQPGTVSVMATFQGHVGVFRATIPLGVAITQLPEPRNLVDTYVWAQLQQLGLPPSPVCDDATFLRRVTIAVAGRLPALQETESFLADAASDKRDQLVNRLLDTTDYADYFATKWGAILRNKRTGDDDKLATFAFYRWIRDSLYHNQPYDQFVRQILTASGDVTTHPATAWYRNLRDPSALVEDTAQLFLGQRIQCARCHHHPFEKWSQRDYHGFSAFYTRIGHKEGDVPGEERIVHQYGKATAQNPKTGETLLPTGLAGQPQTVAPEVDPRQFLADWMVSRDNPFFARALVNRYWKHFFGRGLVDPEDDMRVTNPASNPELLDALASDFVQHGYDLKHLIRTICQSHTYQLTAAPNEYNQKDKQSFSRYYPKRLDAEVLLDSIDLVTGVPTRFDGVPAGMRAVELPDNGFSSYFLTVFGRPEASSACECERSSDASLAQSLHLLNSEEILGKISADNGRAARLAADSRPHDQRIRELYLLAFSREPDHEELEIAQKHIQSKANPREAYEDIVWALINTKEFLFNH